MKQPEQRHVMNRAFSAVGLAFGKPGALPQAAIPWRAFGAKHRSRLNVASWRLACHTRAHE